LADDVKTGGVLVISEHWRGKPAQSTFDAVSVSRKLAESKSSEVKILLMGDGAGEAAETIASDTGHDVICVITDPSIDYNPEAWVDMAERIISERGFGTVVVPHTSTGWDFAPALGAKLSWNCITGVRQVEDKEGIVLVRGAFSGKLRQRAYLPPIGKVVITVMPGAAEKVAAPRAGEVESVHMDISGELRTESLGRIEAEKRSVDLSRAEVVVAAGRGADSDEKLELVRELSSVFDKGVFAASRPLVDSGRVELDRQVGQTGQTVTPKLYLAVGISGAIQHTAGMSGSELIVAVNTDRRASIFDVADIGVIEDMESFLPAFMEAWNESRGK